MIRVPATIVTGATGVPRSPIRADGFTLIEMLVSITLMAIIGIAMAAALRFAQRSLQAVGTVDRESWEVMAAQRFLRNALESASPASGPDRAVSLRGADTWIEFQASSPLAIDGGIMSVFDVRLERRSADSDRQDLVASWSVAPNGSRHDEAPEASEVLVNDVAAVHWNYLPAASQADVTRERRGWLDEWQDRPDLPVLVRLSVTFRNGSRRNWPPLIVQMRLTHDSACVFDVVAQDCRRT